MKLNSLLCTENLRIFIYKGERVVKVELGMGKQSQDSIRLSVQ